MTKNEILVKLQKFNAELEKEGLIIEAITGSFARGEENPSSDLDLLYRLKPTFIERYGGFKAFKKLQEIKEELQRSMQRPIDLIPSNNLSKTAQKYLLSERIDV
jgi:predicted nucleotidyltransferase